MPVGGIQRSGCSHYHLTFCCLVFCLLLFNDFNSFFASPRSHLASDVLLVLLNNVDTVTRKGVSFPNCATALPLAICSCHVPRCHISQLTLCPGLLAQCSWGEWQPCLNYKYPLRLKQTAGHCNGSDIGEGFGWCKLAYLCFVKAQAEK